MSEQKPRILWVEDERDNQEEAEQALGKIFNITFANSAAEAKTLISTTANDCRLIIVDLYLENNTSLDGIQLIEWFEKNHPSKRRIAITKGEYNSLKSARKKGVDDDFRKEELDFEDLATSCENLLYKKRVFISYSRKDQTYLEELNKRLRSFIRNGRVEAWKDKDLIAGENWNQRIKEELRRADIILFLLSEDALNSDYIHDTEIAIAKARHQKGEVQLIPIILRPCDWKPSFGQFHRIPRNIEAISRAEDSDSIWLEVKKEITRLLNK